jgi:Methyltransferase FkbM domain
MAGVPFIYQLRLRQEIAIAASLLYITCLVYHFSRLYLWFWSLVFPPSNYTIQRNINALDKRNNTRPKQQQPTSGLCIEANPIHWRRLSFRDCHIVAAVVGRKRMERVKFAIDEGLSGIVNKKFDNHKTSNTDLSYYTVPLIEIFERKQAPRVIDYLSLDVEGAEYYVLESFPFDEYAFKVMTIERPKDKLKDLLVYKGYEYMGEISDFGETLWINSQYKHELKLDSI